MLYLSFAAGLVLLIVGADVLVRGASKLALSWGVSPLVVGLTVVAFGTSAPELAVSLRGALEGQADIALGNVVGSNILNILLILGISALIVPLVVNRQIVRQEVPIMVGASLLLFGLSLDGEISHVEGGLMFAGLFAYIALLYWQSRRRPADELDLELPPDSNSDRHWAVQLLLIAFGLAMLILGAHWLVQAAIVFAQWLGVSELVIGLTVVSIGTSLPEIATSIIAALRGQRDMAVGNIVGSNIFNILGVAGLTALVAPVALPVSQALITFDMQVMLAAAIACLPILFSGHMIARWEGGMFLGYYFAYTAFLILASAQHDAQDEFATVMQWVVLPITAATLLAITMRELRRRKLGVRPE
jgi:cation:H+ antiporter